MTAEEFLIQQWNKCIWFNHDDYPGNIVMVYDKQHERKLKLNSLNNTNDNIKFIKTDDSVVLFYQDYKNCYFDVNYNEIWSVLVEKYRLEYQEIKDLIKNVLLEDNKLNQLTTINDCNYITSLLLEDNKLNQLTTVNFNRIQFFKLLEDNKLNQLTTYDDLENENWKLLEDNKLKQLTTSAVLGITEASLLEDNKLKQL